MQIKTTMKYRLTLVRVDSTKKTRDSNCGQGYGGQEALVHCWWECKLVQPVWKTVRRCLKKLKIELSYVQHFHFWAFESESESCSVVSNSATPCTIQSMEFSRPEYWCG